MVILSDNVTDIYFNSTGAFKNDLQMTAGLLSYYAFKAEDMSVSS